ncbi:biotin--[acetyl-CoA-carboxylase] ligase [Bacillus mangrovi]|uniref:Bifunctional ligase/repressor BirA n=1 Tax=Metabacillus mangrovi TaxID=1491830 RepID=A0A7X2S1Q6_9BACI|nr:biotin--[acetyl-CoA-carboxylase] ligase [Metabacillus mangrovi]MTH52142.1 biotin--[acetyl-CoA-carboxylase] ligase [Metabacillus mangrovi]
MEQENRNVKQKLLEAFSEAEDDFVSGQKISELLGLSRTAIWKHIEGLRNEGYEVEAVRRMGYRLINKPLSLSKGEIQSGLNTQFIGQSIYYEKSVPSTQKIAHRLAGEGAADGTVVIADEQTEGRGRLARVWYSPIHTGIWMSCILKPKIPISQTPQLTLLAAVAIVQAIEETTGISPSIKWPNDILINGRKAVGILTELQAEADSVHSVIIGTGINVNQSPEDFPAGIQQIATSLKIEKGSEVSRAVLVQAILRNLEQLYTAYLSSGFRPVKLLWESYAISLGKTVIARTLQGTITGKAIGINDEGVLLLETMNGSIEKIYSADIELPEKEK